MTKNSIQNTRTVKLVLLLESSQFKKSSNGVCVFDTTSFVFFTYF